MATAPTGVDFDDCPPVLEYTSVSNTRILTFCPLAITWSSPPKPISYAHPSPPNIHCDFLVKKSLSLRIFLAASHPHSVSTFTSVSVAAAFSHESLYVSTYALHASFTSALSAFVASFAIL